MSNVKVKRKRFVTPWDYDPSRNSNSVTGGVSITVPNQAMSVREIMLRFTRGTPPLSRQAVYNEDEDLPDFDKMDFVEREEFLKENQQRIKELQALVVEAKRGAQAAKERGVNSDSESRVAPVEGASERSEESDDLA